MTVATMKRALGFPSETVLRKRGEHWEPVSNGHIVDLSDREQQYLIGPIAIYS